MPLTSTISGLPGALLVIATAPVAKPAAAGVNWMESVQELCAAMDAQALAFKTEKSLGKPTLNDAVSVAAPMLEIVTLQVVLWPTIAKPQERIAGCSDTSGSDSVWEVAVPFVWLTTRSVAFRLLLLCVRVASGVWPDAVFPAFEDIT